MFHASTCITSVAPSVARILGFAPPKCTGDGNPALEQLAANAFSGRKADRALLCSTIPTRLRTTSLRTIPICFCPCCGTRRWLCRCSR